MEIGNFRTPIDFWGWLDGETVRLKVCCHECKKVGKLEEPYTSQGGKVRLVCPDCHTCLGDWDNREGMEADFQKLSDIWRMYAQVEVPKGN